jgi:hypothetical protein
MKTSLAFAFASTLAATALADPPRTLLLTDRACQLQGTTPEGEFRNGPGELLISRCTRFAKKVRCKLSSQTDGHILSDREFSVFRQDDDVMAMNSGSLYYFFFWKKGTYFLADMNISAGGGILQKQCVGSIAVAPVE